MSTAQPNATSKRKQHINTAPIYTRSIAWPQTKPGLWTLRQLKPDRLCTPCAIGVSKQICYHYNCYLSSLSHSPIKSAGVINVCNEQTCEHSRMISIRCSSYANVLSRNRQTICNESLPVKCEFSMHKKYSNVGLCMKEESNETTLSDFLHKLQSKVWVGKFFF